MPTDETVTPDAVRAAWDQSPYGAVLRDDRRRHQMVIEAMLRSDDPMAREIGEQLRSGAVTPQQVVTSGAYQEYFRTAFAAGEKIDLGKLHTALPDLVASGRLTGDADRDLFTGSTNGKPPVAEERTERR